jgi:hypothetical protein
LAEAGAGAGRFELLDDDVDVEVPAADDLA